MKTDEELMQAYAGGDQAAFRELFARLAPLLLRIIQRTVGRAADAQDIVQQTFLQLHRARKDYRPDMRARPWIITIAMNLARDLLRFRGRRPEANVDDVLLADPRASASAHADAAETSARVRTALGLLPPEQRQVIELHWFEEISFNDIGHIVGATPGVVRVRAHRGYQALRKILGEDGNVPQIEDVP